MGSRTETEVILHDSWRSKQHRHNYHVRSMWKTERTIANPRVITLLHRSSERIHIAQPSRSYVQAPGRRPSLACDEKWPGHRMRYQSQVYKPLHQTRRCMSSASVRACVAYTSLTSTGHLSCESRDYGDTVRHQQMHGIGRSHRTLSTETESKTAALHTTRLLHTVLSFRRRRANSRTHPRARAHTHHVAASIDVLLANSAAVNLRMREEARGGLRPIRNKRQTKERNWSSFVRRRRRVWNDARHLHFCKCNVIMDWSVVKMATAGVTWPQKPADAGVQGLSCH